MPEKTDLNISPYFDDYSEDKKFQKVLFRAGRPLQARELTQTQSILQNQIERFGDHFFKEGSLVTGAQTDIDMEVYFVKVSTQNPNVNGDADVETYRESLHGKILQGKTSGVLAQVKTTTAETTDDKLTIFVHYLSQGTNTAHSYTFEPSEELQVVTLDENGAATDVTGDNNDLTVLASSDTPNGRASLASISEGVVFIRGFFCKVDSNFILLEKYSGKPSYRIGLEVTESLVTNSDDASLKDNATGTNNENAAGADRFKVDLVLTKKLISSTDDANFIELARVNQGQIELTVRRPIYNEIENTLARRTYDTNGDFVLRQFTHSFREHLDDTTNAGYYKSVYGGNEGKVVLQASPGKAYVRGYEIEKVGTTPITLNKARTTVSLTGATTPFRVGNNLEITEVYGQPEFGHEAGDTSIDSYKQVKLYPSEIGLSGGYADTSTMPTEDHIGVARVRDIFEKSSSETSNVLDASSVFKLSLFDVKMFTRLDFAVGNKSGTLNAGDRIVGSVSGAYGIAAYESTGKVYLTDVVGRFVASDTLSSTGRGDFAVASGLKFEDNGGNAVADGYASALKGDFGAREYNIDRVRAVAQETSNATYSNFGANVNLTNSVTLTGTVQVSSSGSTVNGVGSRFAAELKEGDTLINPVDGATLIVSRVVSDTEVTLTGNPASSYNGAITRKRNKIDNANQTASIFAWPRDWVKTHTPDASTVVQQEIKQIQTGGFTISLSTGDTFLSLDNSNFQFTIAKEGSGTPTYATGKNLDIDALEAAGNIARSGNTLTVSGLATENDAYVLVKYGVVKNNPTRRSLSLKKSRVLKVGSTRTGNNNTGASNPYGTCFDDKTISLGIPHVFKIRAIYEANGDGTPLPPNATMTTVSGTFTAFEEIVGQTSDARAILIDYNQGATSYWYYVGDNRFSEGEQVVGKSSDAIATISSVSQGSQNITSKFIFDDGQRDGYYDVAKLIRKTSEPAPLDDILVVFDCFQLTSGGDFFDVQSYLDIDYKDIPVYSPARVDLGGFEPDGQFELSDSVDFRPSVGSQLGVGNNLYSVDPVVTSPTDISDYNNASGAGVIVDPLDADEGRDFESSSASIIGTPRNGESLVGDISFYVPRIDRIFLHKSGSFQISQGTPALSPTKPKGVDDAIELFEVTLPAYTKDLKTIKVRTKDHRRFTMKDIGSIHNRVTNLERVTALSLLEKDTQTKQILDGNGLDRFKSGFLVDNFRGHRVGDVNHPDYNVSVDSKRGHLRPKTYSQFFDISLNTSSSKNYQKTGDLITLPYTQESYVNQHMASRAINVNPYHVFAFTGQVKLTPATDIWQDTERLPEVRINREGNFDAVLAENTNSLGTVWNAWQTTWVGEPETVSSTQEASTNGSWSGDPAQGGEWVSGITVTRDITDTVEGQTRTGVTTSVVEDFQETRNDRVVSVSIVPFMRARTIEIDATNLKPGTNHFVFFDGIDVNKYVRPQSATYSQDGGTTVSSGLKADGNGRIRAFFELPNNDNARFASGMRKLEITSSALHLANPSSSASAIYQAQGLLQSNQTEIVSTRNGRVVIERTSGERSIVRRGEALSFSANDEIPPEIDRTGGGTEQEQADETGTGGDNTDSGTSEGQDAGGADEGIDLPPDLPPQIPPRSGRRCAEQTRRGLIDEGMPFPARFCREENGGGWQDPLAESFLVESAGGMMVSSLDIFFRTKSDSLPVSVEIRNMVNGYPGQNVLPFSFVTKNPADVNVSADGSTATTFTFESPVYLEENTEYCFVVLSNSTDYECFISRMGETDLITGQTISGQPYAGSLFLSQNASTWTAEQTDDLKFNLKICKFDTSKVPTLVFENDALPTAKLQANPIETVSGQDFVKVYSYSHGMYDAKSNVSITGVTGNKTGSVTNITRSSTAETGLPVAGEYQSGATSVNTGSGAGAEFQIEITGAAGNEVVSSVQITKCGSGYAVGNTVTITNIGSGTNTITVTIDAISDTLGGYPIASINQNFTGSSSVIDNIEIDSFTVEPILTGFDFVSSYSASESTVGGGENVYTSRNYYYDVLHTMIPNLMFQETFIYASAYGSLIKSPEGQPSGVVSYTQQASADFITLNDNHFMDSPKVIASQLNETQHLSGAKSFKCQLQLQSFSPNVSPVIDVGTIGCLAIMNRINNIDSSSDVTTGTTYVPSTESEGDNNAMVYCTRKVTLQTPASSLKVFADNFRPANTDLKFMYKLITSDETTPWDEKDWSFFNTDGSPDIAISNDGKNFKEYEYTAEELPEFVGFAIKIVGQSNNTSVVPLVSALRCVALA